MQRLFTALLTSLITLLLLGYPFAVYFGLNYLSARYIALILVLALLLRVAVIAGTAKKARTATVTKTTLILLSAAGIIIGFLGVISNHITTVKLYPVAINFLLLALFSYSLLRPPTIIERVARIKEPDLPLIAVAYTKNVTIVWCIFFAVNGGIALWTALFASMKTWAFYNGFLSYILIGALFVTEFTYRQWVKRKNHI